MTENNINISVVDDEISIREMLGVFLKIKGYTVQMYGDGSEALASDTFFESQIVISDLNMPEVDGLTLLKKVKERNPEIICLLITGMATLDSTITALRAGVDDYILKPFELKDIEMIILKHISRFKLVEENLVLQQDILKERNLLKQKNIELEILNDMLFALRTSYNVNTALEKLRDKFEQLFDFDFSFYFSVEHNAITTYSSHKFPDELKKEICGKIKEYFDDDTKQDIQEFLTSEFKFNTENSLFSDMLIKSLFANDSIVGILGFINLPPKKFISYQRDYFYHLISKLQELIFQIDSIVENQNRILSSIFDQIQSIIIRVDLESGDILTNKAGQDLLDLYKISTCNFDDIKTIFDSDWDEILEEVVNNKTYRGTSLVGEEKDILVFGLNIVAYSDPPVVNEGLLINAKDITDIKKIEDMKADIISNVSHELKTPVAIVKEYLSLLHDEISGPLNEMQHKFVGTISNNLDRLERLISSFLDMSKLNSGKMHTNFEDEKVSGLVNGIIEPFNLRYKNNNMTLTYQPEDSELIFLLDRDMIAQIMVNLLENAYKYAGKNVNVIVKSYVNEHNNLILVVQDNGKGISKKDQKKIFDRFYRAGLEEEARLPGSGLGLSIIKDMIKIIGGEIRLESVLGEGCSFFVELPSPNIEN